MKYIARDLSDIAGQFKEMSLRASERFDRVTGREKELLAREHITWLQAANFLESTELIPKAAPELLEALKNILDQVTNAPGTGQSSTIGPVEEIARAAIARAEGTSP